MSLGLSIQFLSGRYHATPWNHQVNEGVVEWPPSPWRILRALVSAYYRLPERPDRTLMVQLCTQLANQLPEYEMPDCVAAHTRHYMPIWKEGKATTTKVFDTFLVLPGGALSSEATVQVVWAGVQLSAAEQDLLQQLCRQVSYLGRAESWVEMTCGTTPLADCNAVPLERSTLSGSQPVKQVKVLAPLTAEGLEGFQAALATLPKPKKGKLKWKAPADILEALALDIGDLHGQGWNGIPGTRWVTYAVQEQPQRQPLHPRVDPDEDKLPNLARFALSSKVLPKLTEAVSVGERFRKALMSRNKDEMGQVDSVFSGRDTSGDPLKKNHRHARYLPEVNRAGKIDHVVVYASGGFEGKAIQALQELPKVWGAEGFTVQTVLVSLGRAEEYGGEDWRQPGRVALLGKARCWRSLTPMVLPRRPKCDRRYNPRLIPGMTFQMEGPEHQALRLLKQLKGNAALEDGSEQCILGDAAGDWLGWCTPEGQVWVKVRCVEQGVSPYRWQAFQRRRYDGDGDKGSDRGYWLEIEFAEPQEGPIALGYAAHYGLGVFVPVD